MMQGKSMQERIKGISRMKDEEDGGGADRREEDGRYGRED